MRSTVARLLAAASLTALPASAWATWSILLVDVRTGEIALGSATCLSNFDLRANTPVLIPLVGAATAQSFVDSTGQNRVYIRDKMALGVDPTQILTELSTFDSGHQTRQYGMVDRFGRTATFSGTGAGAWAGGQTGGFLNNYVGQVGTVRYAIQGNVLTGSPVVEQAVAAAINTPGDLAAKLMASMQAARSMGGDGRCSCSQAAPTSCGSPPPNFQKSAHIAYMLIGRTGDREGSNGIYRAGSAPQGVACADLTGDGLPEILVTNFATSNVTVMRNLTGTLSSPLFPTFSLLPTNFSTGSGPRGLVVADVTGDANLDVVTADSGANAISVLRGQGNAVFSAPVPYGAGGSPRAVAVDDFDGVNGRDIAVAAFNSNAATILLNNGAGGFAPMVPVQTDTGPIDIAAANLVGSAAVDLVVCCQSAGKLDILRGNGDGTFTVDQALTTGTSPTGVVAADFDGDGDIDVAVACSGASSVQVFTNTAGVFAPTPYSLSFSPVGIRAGRLGAGLRPDLLVSGSLRLVPLMNNGAGVFAPGTGATFAGSAVGSAISDLDGDGDNDVAFANTGLNAAMTIKNLGPTMLGTFNDGLGCATGDYFMNFNVAFQATTAPDPVAQLQGMFDTWRGNLVGHPDAVQSLVYANQPAIGAGSVGTMTIRLRDWQGLPITANVPTPVVEHAPGSQVLGTIGPVVPQGGGVYTVELTAGTTLGVGASLRIRVDDALRAVTLMPDAKYQVMPSTCYANCDGSTTPPVLNVQDFSCFLGNWGLGRPYANCDASTVSPVLNVTDFVCFLNRFAQGCP